MSKSIIQSGQRTGRPTHPALNGEPEIGRAGQSTPVLTLQDEITARIQLPAAFPLNPYSIQPRRPLAVWGSALPSLRDPKGNFTGKRDNSDLKGLVAKSEETKLGDWLPWLNTKGFDNRVLVRYQKVQITLVLGA